MSLNAPTSPCQDLFELLLFPQPGRVVFARPFVALLPSQTRLSPAAQSVVSFALLFPALRPEEVVLTDFIDAETVR